MNELQAPAAPSISPEALEKVLLGDLSSLNAKQRLEYVVAVCKAVGLNPLTKPFEFITLQGKLVMYARRDCADQLRKLYRVSITITGRAFDGDLYVVTAQARDASGRADESIGVVSVKGMGGLDKANALMKAETKAKRRVTLSICGLGMLDETEVEDAVKQDPPPPARYIESERQALADVRNAMGDDASAMPAHPMADGDSGPTSGVPEFTDEPEIPADALANDAQIKAIHTLVSRIGLTDDRYRQRLWGRYKVRTSRDLTVAQASDLIDWLDKDANKREGGVAAGLKTIQSAIAELPRERLMREIGEDMKRLNKGGQWFLDKYGKPRGDMTDDELAAARDELETMA